MENEILIKEKVDIINLFCEAEKLRTERNFNLFKNPNIDTQINALLPTKNEFLDKVNALANNLNCNTLELTKVLLKLSLLFNDNHIIFYPRNWQKTVLRIQIKYLFSKEDNCYNYYITDSINNKEIIFDKLLAVNGVTIQQIVDNLSNYISAENKFWKQHQTLCFLTSCKYLEFIDIKAPYILTLQNKKGDIYNYNLKEHDQSVEGRIDNNLNYIYKLNHSYCENNKIFGFKRIDKNIIGISLSSFNIKENEAESYFNFLDDIKNEIKPNDKLIIDLRNNYGGKSKYCEPFVDIVKSKSSAGCVLVNNGTMSAGTICAYLLKRQDFMLIGEELGNNNIWTGGTSTISTNLGELAISKVIHDMTDIFKNKTIEPDVKITETIESLKNGIDLFENYCKSIFNSQN